VTTTLFDAHIERIAAGERLSADEIRELARMPDLLPLGMLADALRRRLHANRTTFVRVATCPFDQSIADAVPPAARELRLTGSPETLDAAVNAVQAAKSVAGARPVGRRRVHRHVRGMRDGANRSDDAVRVAAETRVGSALRPLLPAGVRRGRRLLDRGEG